MVQEMVSESFRGVLCLHCSWPIRVPHSIMRREAAFRNQDPDSTQDLGSRVFPLRCRHCRREALYDTSEIVDCE